MSYQIIWFYEKRICLVSMNGDIDMPGLGELIHDVWHFLQDGESPVHVILDHTRLKSLPVSPAESSRIFQNVPHIFTRGMLITISRNRLEHFMLTNVQAKLGMHNSIVCTSINEALSVLEKADPSLDGMMSRSG